MIEFDINVEIEKKLLKILKNRTKKFLKYIEDNNINIENEEELQKAAEEYKEKEDKKIFGINKLLLIYTLALFIDGISKKQRDIFKRRMQTELFIKAMEEADKKIRELYINTTKRTAYHLEKYIEELRKNKEKSAIKDFEKIIKDEIIKDKWEEAKQRVEERMALSDFLNANNVLGEIQAEYVKVIFEELGIKGFVWITKHDERVREKHAWRDGKVFDLQGNLLKGTKEDDSKILPKQEWGCRCRMAIDEKVIEEVLKNVS